MENEKSSSKVYSAIDTVDDDVPKNEYIDKLTLELFMNRTNYNKYLEKTDPTKYDKLKEYKIKLQKYMVDIIDMTNELIENPERPPNTEVGEAFSDYSKSIIKFFEMKEMEKGNSFYKRDDEEDENETLFDPEKMEKPRWSKYNVKKLYKNGVFF
uniref:Uncharacterized protein n=1 Tax=viral metagenome TaxID=1070528 RepID=A0A6C0DQZ7_9ZZZZ